jgi:hypothetical protein
LAPFSIQFAAVAADNGAMADPGWRPLGEILVERGLLDRYELAHWLTQQKLSGMLLGELLVLHRVISPVDVAAALAVQRGANDVAGGIHDPDAKSQQSLGRVLVTQGLITDSGLQRALLTQRRTGGALGDIVVERGWATQEQIDEAMAQHAKARDGAADDEDEPAEQPAPERYEVLGPFVAEPVHVSEAFLDATDYAFDLIERDDPHALEIVRVKGTEREQVWSYSREASERYREATSATG